MKILITGSAGFIGFHVAMELLKDGHIVFGVDNLNSYYDVSLKTSRNNLLKKYQNYNFYELDICGYEGLKNIFKANSFDKVCHLAAQPGVRYSIENPFIYQKTNNEGFLNIIECARQYKVNQFIYASSSSVYGANKKIPFSVVDRVDRPLSLYAATKRSNELVAYAYSHLYGINTIGLRFFTVYGPWGRPDMSYFLFTGAILNNKPINVFNNGRMKRNFTYVDDVVAGVKASLGYEAKYEIFNLGNDRTEELMDFIDCIEKNLNKKAKKNLLPIQPGDVLETWADIDTARKKLGYCPRTDIAAGITNFINWYKDYYGIRERNHV
ncbi:GDP-mannose 4,6-dehydratase [Candidatus Saganbacteria bacterium]|nr:GDP-mannose 4,6-dehydratase [Candidatus Saganbacteria bacterium]